MAIKMRRWGWAGTPFRDEDWPAAEPNCPFDGRSHHDLPDDLTPIGSHHHEIGVQLRRDFRDTLERLPPDDLGTAVQAVDLSNGSGELSEEDHGLTLRGLDQLHRLIVVDDMNQDDVGRHMPGEQGGAAQRTIGPRREIGSQQDVSHRRSLLHFGGLRPLAMMAMARLSGRN